MGHLIPLEGIANECKAKRFPISQSISIFKVGIYSSIAKNTKCEHQWQQKQ